MMRLVDECDLERSRELERRLDRDEERELPWLHRSRTRPHRRFRLEELTMSSTVTSRTIHASPETNGSYLKPWVWPLPGLGGSKPVAIVVKPEYVELGYKIDATLPALLTVFAAHDGVCVYAGKSGDSYAVCIDHPGGWSTQYGGLKHVFFTQTDRFRRRRKQRVYAGDAIGYAQSPSRVRFTLAKLKDADEGLASIDPTAYMKQWLVLPWTSTPSTPARAPNDVAA